MKKSLLLFSGMLALSYSAQAQVLKEEYMKWPESTKLGEFVEQWTPGEELFEDENFYISRVKPKAFFRNAATQINEELTPENDKKLAWWVPIGDAKGGSPNARPNGKFDSEVFSTWSYVTHYGNWTAGHGWVPGGFADVAHKNGVAVSGVASIPWGSITGEWYAALSKLGGQDPEKVAKFLHYHGVDGLGYNSEFSGNPGLDKLRTLHETIHRYLTAQGNPVVENLWYDGTNDNGSITFDQGLYNHNNDTFGDGEHIRTSLFLNYNWNGYSVLNCISSLDQYAPGRSSLDLYAGFNMQGGQPRSWTLLKDYNFSIGMWGAHETNMIWADRGKNGGSDDAKQNFYQTQLEWFFSNGNRNPIDKIAVADRGNHRPDEKFFGMSAFMSARSTLKWDLGEEPFISFFNLGNGKFFNWKGVRQNNNEWYNIGVQDYLPNWRWWFANKFLGKNQENVVANGLDAKFTFDDAYVGGSCLRIFGSVADEYLHLFKTEFALKTGDVITVRYKLVGGKANINLALSAKGAETEILREKAMKVLTTDAEADDEVWVEKKFEVKGSLAALNGKEIAMVALQFENAENLDLYLGEFSITRGATATPAKPTIKLAKVLANHHKGVDAKLIFNMPNDKPAGEPVYNLDVNASMFKLYAQQEGEKEQFMGITSSWAGMFYSVPTNVEGSQKIRFGVAAVSVDTNTDSEIVWSEYQEMGEPIISNDIEINKTTIKPGESFEIKYVDPRHAGATWELVNGKGETVKTAENVSVFTVAEGLQEIGGYDLKVTYNGNTTTYGYYVQITSEEVGALPEIYSLTVNGKKAEEGEINIEINDELTLGYTGRKANGASSRGLDLNEGFVGGPCDGLELSNKTFSISAWVRFTDTREGMRFFQIDNRTGAWPQNNWGWMWSNLHQNGTLECYTFRSAGHNGATELMYKFPNTVITPNAWNHVVLVFEYDNKGGFRSLFYLNGIRQESTWEFGSTKGTTESYCSINFPIAAGDWFAFAGGAGPEPVFGNGIIDDLLIWDGAMTQEEVNAAKAGFKADALSDKVIAYWDFETDAAEDGNFAAVGQKAGAKACNFKLQSGSAEGEGKQMPQNPLYISGCPFIAGTAFKVETKPTWTAKRGVLTESEGTDQAGSTKLTYTKDGDYNVTLALENTLGLDTKTYPVIKVTDPAVSIDENATAETVVYAVDNFLFMEFATEGNYAVSVYTIDGTLAAQQNVNAGAGQLMSIALGSKGVYVVKIASEGKVVRTVKVMNR